jgi:exosortase J
MILTSEKALATGSRTERRLDIRIAVGLACVSAGLGLLAIWSSVYALVGIWHTDALKSIGLAIPFVCFALILREWRRLGWETEGTWWGFALLAGSALLVFVRDQTLLIVTVNKNWLLQLPPLPLVAVLYATALVLLFGGRRLLRAAWFPVLLMWAVIPVPQTFNRAVDLPLQHAGASVARAFAGVLGVHLTAGDLRLMFTPNFGMFIAPGCDGIRGAVTLGLTALVVAYVYRFRWFVFAPLVVGGVLLGYLFNFLRLCSLVIFDRIAVSYPSLQPHEQLADHIVGGCLFLCALAIFFAIIERLRQDPADTAPAPVDQTPSRFVAARPVILRAVAVLALAAVFGIDLLHNGMVNAASSTAPADLAPMPDHVGAWRLVRTWQDTTMENILVYTWGEYASPDPVMPHVSLGISPLLSIHDAEVCHIARGEDPTWHGQITAPSPAGELALTAATYNNGAVQRLEASTVCDGGSCRQYSQTSKHVTLVFARPHKGVPLQKVTGRAVPVLLKVESLDTSVPVSVAEPRMAAALEAFLAQADLPKVTAPFGNR